MSLSSRYNQTMSVKFDSNSIIFSFFFVFIDKFYSRPSSDCVKAPASSKRTSILSVLYNKNGPDYSSNDNPASTIDSTFNCLKHFVFRLESVFCFLYSLFSHSNRKVIFSLIAFSISWSFFLLNNLFMSKFKLKSAKKKLNP